MISRPWSKYFKILLVIYALYLLLVWYKDASIFSGGRTQKSSIDERLLHPSSIDSNANNLPPTTVHIGAVSFGKRYAEIVVQTIKFALLLSRAKIQWYVFTIDNATDIIQEGIQTWPDAFKQRVSVVTIPLDCVKWKQYLHANVLRGIALKPCVLSDIENTEIKNHTEKFIFIDLDTFIVDDLVNLWNYFSLFTSDHIMALARADLRYIILNYSHYTYDRRYGVNTGVILINFRHMAGFNFEERYIGCSQEKFYFESNETRDIGQKDDQNILNVLFYKYPYKVLPLGCNWNFRGSMDMQCAPGEISNCDEAISQGVSLLHIYSDTYLPRSHYAEVYNCTINLDLYHIDRTVRCLHEGIKMFQLHRNKRCNLHVNNLRPLETALKKLYPQIG